MSSSHQSPHLPVSNHIMHFPFTVWVGYQPRYSLQRQNVLGKVLTWHCTNEHREADDFSEDPHK